MNKIVLSGNLVRNLELRYVLINGANKPVIETVMAVRRDFTEETDFITIQVWGKQAENLDKYCGKGSKILIHGSLRITPYKNKEGKTIYKNFVLVDSIEFLDSKPKAKEEPKQEIKKEDNMQVYEDFGKDFPITDDMLPF